jgi:hypothetical protein
MQAIGRTVTSMDKFGMMVRYDYIYRNSLQ